jgi:hypothetical protein
VYITKYMELSASWEANRRSAIEEFPAFYGTRNFITVITRVPATGPFPELDDSSPHPPTPKEQASYPSIYAYAFLAVPFLNIFIPKLSVHFSHLCYMSCL